MAHIVTLVTLRCCRKAQRRAAVTVERVDGQTVLPMVLQQQLQQLCGLCVFAVAAAPAAPAGIVQRTAAVLFSGQHVYLRLLQQHPDAVQLAVPSRLEHGGAVRRQRWRKVDGRGRALVGQQGR